MTKHTETQIETFVDVTRNSLEVRRLGKLLNREITEFDSIEDFYTHLDQTMDAVEFCGSTVVPSQMAKMTSKDGISTVNADHQAWLGTIDKRDLLEFKGIEAKFQEHRKRLGALLDFVENDMPTEESPSAPLNTKNESASETKAKEPKGK
jgi:hypothetical protein